MYFSPGWGLRRQRSTALLQVGAGGWTHSGLYVTSVSTLAGTRHDGMLNEKYDLKRKKGSQTV